ncbi:succinate dehydrogenase/fumarate reductase transmembrane subunit, partial [Staphylococcus epidermidis]|uniref:succinate dehydrogenase n=1 Tax=Staphylococcus epidermidis TaxID=1282 RepID=UPI0021B265AA
LPFLILIQFILIYIPFLYHPFFPLHIPFTPNHNIPHYSLFTNCIFFFQPVTPILPFLFIPIHLSQTPFQKPFYPKSLHYNLIHQTLQHPLCPIFYIISLIPLLFHFPNPLSSFSLTSRFLQSKKSQPLFTSIS